MHYPEPIRITAEIGLRDALHSAAEREGVSFSQLVRDLLRREVARRGIPIVATAYSRPIRRGRPIRRRSAETSN